MDKQQLLTLADLEAFFEKSGRMHLNDNGVDIQITEDVWIATEIWTGPPVIFSLIMSVEEDDPEFSEKLAFRNEKDIETIDQKYLWERYRKGYAKVYASMEDLFDMSIVFQQDEGRTRVYMEGRETMLIDVLPEVSDQVDWFRTYIRKNAMRWYVMAEEQPEF